MCESRQHIFANQRSCEMWARKELEKRISLVLAVAKNTKGWTQYYQKKSICGTISLLQNKYPMVGAITEDRVAKGDYECCVSFKEAMDACSIKLEEHEDNCEASVSATLNASGNVKSGEGEPYEFYSPLKKALAEARVIVNEEIERLEVLINHFHTKYGLSIQEKSDAKKTNKNKRKERKRKATQAT